MAKCYVRNGVWGWPVDRQIKALGDLWDADASYRDTLLADRAKAPGRVRPEWLVEREKMLRPSARRQDTIHVATLLAIAVGSHDLVKVIEAAGGRNATIVAHDSGMSIPAGCDVDVVVRAMDDWERAKAAARTEPGRLEGMRVAAERRRAETMRKTRIARPLWRDTSPKRLSAEQVAERAELSVKTLYAELGRRPRIKRKGQADAGLC